MTKRYSVFFSAVLLISRCFVSVNEFVRRVHGHSNPCMTFLGCLITAANSLWYIYIYINERVQRKIHLLNHVFTQILNDKNTSTSNVILKLLGVHLSFTSECYVFCTQRKVHYCFNYCFSFMKFSSLVF